MRLDARQNCCKGVSRVRAGRETVNIFLDDSVYLDDRITAVLKG